MRIELMETTGPECTSLDQGEKVYRLLLEELKDKRPVEVDRTEDGKYIVLYMQFEKSPPPKADSEKGALQGFIEMMLKRKGEEDNLPEADTIKEEHSESRT